MVGVRSAFGAWHLGLWRLFLFLFFLAYIYIYIFLGGGALAFVITRLDFWSFIMVIHNLKNS